MNGSRPLGYGGSPYIGIVSMRLLNPEAEAERIKQIVRERRARSESLSQALAAEFEKQIEREAAE